MISIELVLCIVVGLGISLCLGFDGCRVRRLGFRLGLGLSRVRISPDQ